MISSSDQRARFLRHARTHAGSQAGDGPAGGAAPGAGTTRRPDAVACHSRPLSAAAPAAAYTAGGRVRGRGRRPCWSSGPGQGAGVAGGGGGAGGAAGVRGAAGTSACWSCVLRCPSPCCGRRWVCPWRRAAEPAAAWQACGRVSGRGRRLCSRRGFGAGAAGGGGGWAGAAGVGCRAWRPACRRGSRVAGRGRRHCWRSGRGGGAVVAGGGGGAGGAAGAACVLGGGLWRCT